MEGQLLEAVRGGEAAAVARLLRARADVNAPDELGETPIFEATAAGQAAVLALLLLGRADVGYESPQGLTARQMASESTAEVLDLWQGRKARDLRGLDRIRLGILEMGVVIERPKRLPKAFKALRIATNLYKSR